MKPAEVLPAPANDTALHPLTAIARSWPGAALVVEVVADLGELVVVGEHRATLAGIEVLAGLEAEVKDLKNGLEAIEERARFELGMVRDNEVFFQVLESAPQAAAPKAPGTK